MILDPNKDLSLITLKALNQLYELSPTAISACAKNGLLNLDKIISFYLEHKSFGKLRLIGQRTDQELIRFCQHFLSHPARYDAFIKQETFIYKKIVSLPILQKEMVQQQIHMAINALPTSVYNVIMRYLGNNLSYDSFVATFIKKEVNFSIHRNIGTKTEQQITTLVQQIEKIALDYADVPDNTLNNRKFITVFTNTFLVNSIDEAALLSILEKKPFHLFYFLHYLLENESFMKSQHLYMLKHSLGYFETEIESFVSIAQKMGVTREWPRQLHKSANSLMNSLWHFLATYTGTIQSFTNYILPQTENYLYITPKFVTEINQSENTHFSKKLVAQCFGALYQQTHCLIGVAIKSFKNAYLVRKQLGEAFSFEDCFETIHHYQQYRLPKTGHLHFVDFISNFIDKNQFNLLEAIQLVCKNIILNEYAENIEFDAENNIQFKRNKNLSLNEKIELILNAAGTPMKFDEIYISLKNNYSINTVRYHLHKEKNIFMHFGRNSTFGLVEWETTQDNMKGGTIREMVANYLESVSEPKHISEITNYVLKYRPKTNVHNINTSLSAEKTQRFKEFKGLFWGLSSKKYEDTDFNDAPLFFLKYVKRFLLNSTNVSDEDISAELCLKFKLKAIQVQCMIERYLKEGRLRRENNFLEIC